MKTTNVPRKHIVITGTGRTGTTFLVELLSHLGLDTGFKPGQIIVDKVARAGLELDIRNVNAPYVIKTPWFVDYVNEVLLREDIIIEHIFIPMREISSVAESRKQVDKKARAEMDLLRKLFKKSSTIKGGLWHARNKKEQEIVLLKKIYDLLLSLSDNFIPITFMRFPRIVQDGEYLYGKLHPILNNIDLNEFLKVFSKVARPKLVHNFIQK